MEKFIISLLLCSAIMSIISIIMIVLSRLLRNVWSAKRRYYLWLIVLIGFLTPFKPRFTDAVCEINVNEQAAENMYAANQLAADTSTITSALHNNTALFLFVGWIAGVLFLSVRYAVSQYHFQKHIERMSKPCSQEILSLANKVAEQMEISDIKVILLQGISSPMMTGFHSPTIILPEYDYPHSELRLIFKHELLHFKRYDLLYKLFTLLCRTIHWFNPFMTAIVNIIERECELACDEEVMFGESYADRKLYCQSILSTVTLHNKGKKTLKPVIASNFGNAGNNLRHRLMMIVSSRKKKNLGIICLIVALTTFFSGTVFAISNDTHTITIESNVPSTSTTAVLKDEIVVRTYPVDEPEIYPDRISDNVSDMQQTTTTATSYIITDIPETYPVIDTLVTTSVSITG